MDDDLTPTCYPECGKWLAQRLALPAPPSLQPGRYDVALWWSWPPRELPIIADGVEAESPFAAIEHVMRLHRWRVAAHVTACPTGGGSLHAYRAFAIELPKKRPQAESEVEP